MKMKNILTKLTFLLIGISIFTSCEKQASEDKKIADETNTTDWLAYGRTHSEQHFSPIKDIDTNTVSNLKVDWFLDLPNDIALFSTSIQHT